eukprot:TRINITY_DN1640_c0_g1_i1.p1 TRINITY_DN1640_c0_g1~~TRINITY_DN1640_c0_g1_i1.p1  ORF type:complete len:419 (+),score=118.93 TRINITY_DN1640_c0_g1_i1:132-1388(+)
MSMQITLKPLKGDIFTVEANPEDKIGDLKKKIAEARSEFPAESQKLIYSGKILADDATIQDSGVSSSGFVVVMVTKAKPAAAAAEAAAPAAAAATPAAAPAAATPAAAPNPSAAAAATMMTGPDMEASITQLCAMGFERDQVQRCLQAAFGNPDRAVEYLMSGIPEGILPPAGGALPAAGRAAAAPGAAGGGGMAPGAFPAMPAPGSGPRAELPAALAELRQNPQFAQLAAMVSQNPQMLAQMLPALQQTHPEIMQAIQSNPQAFMEMLTEAGGGGGGGAAQDPVAAMLAAGGGGAGAGRGGQMAQLAAALQANPAMLEQMLPEILPEIEANDPAQAQAIRENPQLLLQMLQQAGAMGGGGGMPGGGGVIRLTEEENAAVERLCEMGFERNAAAQAYLACDKNEELAANFLFDNAGQD